MLLQEGTEFKEMTSGSSVLHRSLFFILLNVSVRTQFFLNHSGKGLLSAYCSLEARLLDNDANSR